MPTTTNVGKINSCVLKGFLKETVIFLWTGSLGRK